MSKSALPGQELNSLNRMFDSPTKELHSSEKRKLPPDSRSDFEQEMRQASMASLAQPSLVQPQAVPRIQSQVNSQNNDLRPHFRPEQSIQRQPQHTKESHHSNHDKSATQASIHKPEARAHSKQPESKQDLERINDRTSSNESSPSPALELQGLPEGLIQSILELEVQDEVTGDQEQNLSSSSALSGGDFLDTLNAIKNVLAKTDGDKQEGSFGKEADLGQAFNSFFKEVKDGKEPSNEADFTSVLNPYSFQGMASLQQNGDSVSFAQKADLAAQVVVDSQGQEKLSQFSLQGLGQAIRNSATGSSIRVRLNPGNLGEINLQVATQGDKVLLKIQASNDRSKKIIEESLTSLKENLSVQRLDLASVDLTVSSNPESSQGFTGSQAFSNSDSSYQFGQSSGNSNRGSFERESGFNFSDRLPKSIASLERGRSGQNRGSQGRIDVLA